MSDALPRQVFPAGARIFTEGESGQFAYVIESGNVEMLANRNGRKVILARLGEGDLLGEAALLDDDPRVATAVAVEDTQVIVLKKSALEERIANSDESVQLLLRLSLERLRSLEQLAVTRTPGMTKGHGLPKRASRDAALVEDLQGAIEGEGLALHYQPIVNLADGHIAGVEALIRWNHPAHGNVVPSSFIALAEDTGMIVPMGRWMLRQALKAHAEFQAAMSKAPPLLISVNISSRQLLADGEVADLCRIISESGIPSDQVLFEITESLMVEEPEKVADAMRRLRTQGVHIAADDFGTGYANLAFLNRFPLDILKIDRSFITNMGSDQRSRKIVDTVVKLAQDLGMKIVAEGIEAREEIEVLRELGCDYGQGFLLSPPVPEADVIPLLNRRVRW